MSDPHTTLVIFGATGDLAQRMLFPSLYSLDADGLLPREFRIIGAARSSLDREAFVASALAAIRERLSSDHVGGDVLDRFAARLDYAAVDVKAERGFDALSALLESARDRTAFYLSTPPDLFAPVVEGLRAARLVTPATRIAMEKPIGHDLPSSRAVNEAVARVFNEDQVFRVDHYLGKETVQNLLVLRFANRLFEPLWNAGSIDHVQITVAETVGLEGRVSYYDGVGALADMVQNHMLQLLALVAMEPPAAYTAAAVRDEKVKVLRSLRPFDAHTAAQHSVRGQYRSGAIDGKPVPAYADELGAASSTETFVALKAHVDNWRWRGVPFYLRTGKRLPQKHSEIVVRFKPVPHSIFARAPSPNALVIRLQPEEGIALSTMTKQPGLDRGGIRMREVELDVSLTREFEGYRRRSAYERLLLDLIEGDTTLFVRSDEIEAAWAWIDSIHAAWEATEAPARPYTAGSWGPSAAAGMIERDGASWQDG